ncbi:hypothetical protein Tco_0585481 [Tanacetum coccineum]
MQAAMMIRCLSSGGECGPPAETMSLQRTKLTPGPPGNTSGETSESRMSSSSVSPQSSTTMEEDIRRERYPRILNLNLEKHKGIMRRIAKGRRNTRRPLQPTTKSGLLDIARTEVALAVLYLTKAEAEDQICRAIQYGSKFLNNGEAGATNINSDFSPELYLQFVNDSHALICPTALGTHLPICWGKVCILFLADLVFCEMLIRVEYGEGERLMPRQKMFKELDGKLKSICMQKGGRQPTGMVSPMAKAGGFTFVSDMIHAKGAQDVCNYKRVKETCASQGKLITEEQNPPRMNHQHHNQNQCQRRSLLSELHGGYGYDVPTGRRDGVVSLTCETTGLQCREDLALPDCATCVARVVTLLRRCVNGLVQMGWSR